MQDSPTPDAPFWTEAEGSPAARVRCSCGFTRRVAGDVDADRVLAEHMFLHELVVPVWTAEEEAAAQVVRDVFAPVMDALPDGAA